MTAARQYVPYTQSIPQETDQEALARLADLSAFEYERCREAQAQALGVRPAILDKEVARARGKAADAAEDVDNPQAFMTAPEAWEEPVELVDLLDKIVEEANCHLVLPAGAPEVLALWAIFSHAQDAFHISPNLVATSPSPECGKSTLLTFMSALVPKPCPASNLTTAAIFRAIEKWSPTLLIDEGDTFLRGSEEMRGVLNSGHLRTSAFVIRVVGDDHEPKLFSTWSPKLIALIGKLPDTLASRSIHVEMRRKTAAETVKPLRADRLDHLVPLCRQAARWAADNVTALSDVEPKIPSEIYGRAADNWRPLLAIADAAGGTWPERARQIAIRLGGRREEQTASIMLLEDIKTIFAEERVDRIPSQELVAKLVKMEDRPWVEWRHEKPITPRQVAKLLEQFKIAPRNIKSGGTVPKGYMAEDFADAFARYTASESATPLLSNNCNGLAPEKSATFSSAVADENRRKPNDFNGGSGVAGKKTSNGQSSDGPENSVGADRCEWCRRGPQPGDPLLPYLNGTGGNHLVHRACHSGWLAARAAGHQGRGQSSLGDKQEIATD